MKLPYGISDFRSLRKEGYLYIDKTEYVAKLEAMSGKYLFLIRPRRFGKSLFLSTLSAYYDLNAEAEFGELFSDLYIGRNPTPLKNNYLVLELDFSALNTTNKTELERSFKMRLIDSITGFLNKYRRFLGNTAILEARMKDFSDAGSIFHSFVESVKESSRKIYLIIDEYDHFANDLIAMGDGEFYREIVRATGFVRDFYEAVKIGTKSVIDRIFITGISPIMLDDLTSGFNIATNLTMNETLNEIMGFTTEEVMGIAGKTGVEKEQDQFIAELKKYYNGYLFNTYSSKRLYNPDMILYFFIQWQSAGRYPDELIDDNVKTDYGRLNRLASNEKNQKTLEAIIKEEVIEAPIVTKFSFDRMYDDEYFVSLLFYLGLLTIQGRKYGNIEFTIPNYVIRTVFWEYFKIALKKKYSLEYKSGDLAKAIWQMAFEGKLEPFLEFVSVNILHGLSNRDTIRFDEKYLKIILISNLVATGLYHPVSEREVENGYLDLYLERDIRTPDVKYEWLLELKYLKKADQKKLEQVKKQGLRQLKDYAASKHFTSKKDLKKALIIFSGKNQYSLTEL
jgi:hypothetical protein